MGTVGHMPKGGLLVARRVCRSDVEGTLCAIFSGPSSSRKQHRCSWGSSSVRLGGAAARSGGPPQRHRHRPMPTSSNSATGSKPRDHPHLLFINGSASLANRAADGADTVEDPSVANSMINALKLAAAFARLNQPATDKEGLICGKLVLQDSRGFWNGTDLDLTIGEYRIIELLRSRPGRYVSYRAIRNKFRALDPSSERSNATGRSATAGASRIDRGAKERRRKAIAAVVPVRT